MDPTNDIPPEIVRAYRILEEANEVELISAPQRCEDGRANRVEFRCRVAVPEPNAEQLPGRIEFRVELPIVFPYAPPVFFPEGDCVRGFPHQDAETGKLCLPEEAVAPWDERKLLHYTRWAKEWLADAAQAKLLCDGDPFELPDFSRRHLQGKAPNLTLMFDEDASTFPTWSDHVGKAGRVELQRACVLPAIMPIRFTLDGGGSTREISWPGGVADPAKSAIGRWLLLPDFRYHRHRPAQTFWELNQLCERCGIDLDRNLRQAWEEENHALGAAIMLVGSPIPRRTGDTPSEIHWQPVFFASEREHRSRFKKGSRRQTRGSLWTLVRQHDLKPSAEVQWGKSRNISRGRLYARGAHVPTVQSNSIAVFGCGALGSAIAELLARGGASRLALFDGDRFELDNQCRHLLDGRHVDLNKALCLAQRLASVNPHSEIRGFPLRIPFPQPDTDDVRQAVQAMSSAEILLDCTTNEGAFIWLSSFAKREGKRLVSVFFDFGASLLTMCISGRHTSCRRVAKALYASIRDGLTPVLPDEYFRVPGKDEQVLPGAGCWHPTFPARLDHVWMLAGAATDLLNRELSRPATSQGTAILIRRNSACSDGDLRCCLVEVAWRCQYR